MEVRNVPGELEICLLLPAVPQVAVEQQKNFLTFSKHWLLCLFSGDCMVHTAFGGCF